MGVYSEQIPFGGQLKITRDSWEIEYYFPGPDLRYNGEFKRVPGTSIDSYIQAFRDAWAEYVRLKGSLPTGGEFSKFGRHGLHIRIGGYASGVSLHAFKPMVSSEEELDRLVAAYEWAKQRALQVQSALAKL
jgi:hypothetical protein